MLFGERPRLWTIPAAVALVAGYVGIVGQQNDETSPPGVRHAERNDSAPRKSLIIDAPPLDSPEPLLYCCPTDDSGTVTANAVDGRDLIIHQVAEDQTDTSTSTN